MLEIDPRAFHVLFIQCSHEPNESSIIIRNPILLMRKLIRSSDYQGFTVSMSFICLLLPNRPETLA